MEPCRNQKLLRVAAVQMESVAGLEPCRSANAYTAYLTHPNPSEVVLVLLLKHCSPEIYGVMRTSAYVSINGRVETIEREPAPT